MLLVLPRLLLMLALLLLLSALTPASCGLAERAEPSHRRCCCCCCRNPKRTCALAVVLLDCLRAQTLLLEPAISSAARNRGLLLHGLACCAPALALLACARACCADLQAALPAAAACNRGLLLQLPADVPSGACCASNLRWGELSTCCELLMSAALCLPIPPLLLRTLLILLGDWQGCARAGLTLPAGHAVCC